MLSLGCQPGNRGCGPRDWLQWDVGSLSTLPDGRALNLSRDGEEHCLNPQLSVNYLVESCQNNALVAVEALMAAVAGTKGFQL